MLPDKVCSTPHLIECRRIIDSEERHLLTQELARAIHTLWADDDVRAATSDSFDRSALHFLDSILRINSPDYIPIDSDILRCKIHAPPPMEEVSFDMAHRTYSLICPRQPLATKHKWLPCFEGISGLFFVFNLENYDQSVCFHCLYPACIRPDSPVSVLNRIMCGLLWIYSITSVTVHCSNGHRL